MKRTGGCIFARACYIYIPRPCKLYNYKTVYHLVFERLYWCQDGEVLGTYFIIPWSRVCHYQLHCSYFSISPLAWTIGLNMTWKCSFRTLIVLRPERVWKQVWNCDSSNGGFVTLHVRVNHVKIKIFIITQIHKNSTKFVVKRELRSTRQSCGHCFWSLDSTIPFVTLTTEVPPQLWVCR